MPETESPMNMENFKWPDLTEEESERIDAINEAARNDMGQVVHDYTAEELADRSDAEIRHILTFTDHRFSGAPGPKQKEIVDKARVEGISIS